MYKLTGVISAGNRLSFKTEPRVGVSYQFSGRVLEEGHYPIKGYSHPYVARTIMVEGRIVRRLFGFKITESEIGFTKGFGC